MYNNIIVQEMFYDNKGYMSIWIHLSPFLSNMPLFLIANILQYQTHNKNNINT